MSGPRRAAFAAAALALLLCSACQVTIAVGVDAAANGSGVVRAGVGLDDSALRALPDLSSQLRVDDLRRAGWTVVGPRKERGGRTWVRATKRFADAAGARRVVAQLNGPSGPFRDFRLTRHHPLLRTKTSFSGTVDLASANSLVDAQLRQQAAGSGVDPADLEQEANAIVNRSFRFEVVAHLPGSVHSNAPTAVEGGAVWHPKFGERARLTASSTAWNLRPVVFGALAVLAAAAAAVVWRRGRGASRSGDRSPRDRAQIGQENGGDKAVTPPA